MSAVDSAAAGPLGCVWDLDGVLVDSGVAHDAAWQALADELGYPWSAALFTQTFGMRNPDIIRIAWGVTEPVDQVTRWGDRKEALFRERARTLSALPGAAELVRDLAAHGWRQAIGSSAPRANITLLLDVLGLAGCFDAIVAGDEIQHGKPDPEVFSTALVRLGVAPRRGVVIEDAIHGVEAGVAAGAYTIGVTNTRSAADLRAAGAGLVLDSLAGLTAAELEAKVRERGAASGARG